MAGVTGLLRSLVPYRFLSPAIARVTLACRKMVRTNGSEARFHRAWCLFEVHSTVEDELHEEVLLSWVVASYAPPRRQLSATGKRTCGASTQPGVLAAAPQERDRHLRVLLRAQPSSLVSSTALPVGQLQALSVACGFPEVRETRRSSPPAGCPVPRCSTLEGKGRRPVRTGRPLTEAGRGCYPPPAQCAESAHMDDCCPSLLHLDVPGFPSRNAPEELFAVPGARSRGTAGAAWSAGHGCARSVLSIVHLATSCNYKSFINISFTNISVR